MGQIVSAIGRLIRSQKNIRIVMLGLDAAGKTTILYKFKLGELVTTIPTIGFNVEQVVYGNIAFTIWDVGGQTKIRPLWKYYFQNTQALIYVVDSADASRLTEARDELHAILEDNEMDGVKLLVYANKQDLPNALSPTELTRKLNLHSLKGRDWYIQSSNAKTGEGLVEGLDWLEHQLR